ncbi:hypothetical protein B0H14DRAFT_3425682 [Mycena olivaceomarginata]|nr:hypothetical protein B0H14DRAFT_3425682 [Mycena olivaceomarginata]
MKGWKAFHRPQPPTTLPEPNHNDAYTTSDDWSTCRAATPPIYEGGITASTRAVAPAKCPKYPGARTFSAFTWSRFLDLWTLDCAEYHEHEYETPEVRVRAALKVRQHLRSVAHYEQLVAANEAIREEEAKRAEEGVKRAEEGVKRAEEGVKQAEEEAKRVKREEMEYLAATRPPPVPLSPQRAQQLFDRVLGLASFNGNHPTSAPPQTPACIATFDDHAHVPTTRLSGLPPYTSVQELETRPAPALYAIHANGRNRVFNNRARAVEVLEDTPGGELIFVGDKQNLWRFLDDQ